MAYYIINHFFLKRMASNFRTIDKIHDLKNSLPHNVT